VGDRGTERPLARALGVDVDPLVVASGLGKLVDLGLGHGVPVAHGHFLANTGGQRIKGGKGFHGLHCRQSRASALSSQ